MTTDERALTEEKEHVAWFKEIPVYKKKDLCAALELLRERLNKEELELAENDRYGPVFDHHTAFYEVRKIIDSAFPAFAKEEKEPQGPILKKVPCVNCGWNYVYRIDGGHEINQTDEA